MNTTIKKSSSLKVHHIGLWVSDLTSTGRFYERILGFEKQYAYRLPSEVIQTVFGRKVKCQVAVYRRDEVALELFRPAIEMADAAQAPLIPGVNHFGLQVADSETFCEKAREKGADVIELDRGDHLVYFLRDPDGVLIEIKDK